MSTYNEVARVMEYTFNRVREMREAGQKEYAQDHDNAFANFERMATDVGIDRKKVLWVYLGKHIDGIKSFLKGHKQHREPIDGRFFDAICYLVLLYAMALEDRGEAVYSGELRSYATLTNKPYRAAKDEHNAGTSAPGERLLQGGYDPAVPGPSGLGQEAHPDR